MLVKIILHSFKITQIVRLLIGFLIFTSEKCSAQNQSDHPLILAACWSTEKGLNQETISGNENNHPQIHYIKFVQEVENLNFIIKTAGPIIITLVNKML